MDDVFSYKVVERRGIIPLGPTVRFPFDGSNLDVALLLGLTGLANAAERNKNLVNNHLRMQSAVLQLSAAEDTGFGCADTGRFWAPTRAVFSLIVAESIVFCRLKLLLL